MINDLAHYALEIYITTFFVQILFHQQNDKKDHNRTRNTLVEKRKSATH